MNADAVPGGRRPSNQPIWAVSLPVGCCFPHPPSRFIIIAQSKSRYSLFYCVLQSRRAKAGKRRCRRATVDSFGGGVPQELSCRLTRVVVTNRRKIIWRSRARSATVNWPASISTSLPKTRRFRRWSSRRSLSGEPGKLGNLRELDGCWTKCQGTDQNRGKISSGKTVYC